MSKPTEQPPGLFGLAGFARGISVPLVVCVLLSCLVGSPQLSASDSASSFAEALVASFEERWLGQPFQSSDVVDLDGEAVDFEALRGSVVVLNFWFIACPPCVTEIPKLNAVVEAHADDPVAFFALTFDEAPALAEFLAEHPFRYRVVPTTLEHLGELGVSAYPSHLVIGRDGRVVSVVTGFESGAQISAAVEEALATGEAEADGSAE